jgi:hypothetical protein
MLRPDREGYGLMGIRDAWREVAPMLSLGAPSVALPKRGRSGPSFASRDARRRPSLPRRAGLSGFRRATDETSAPVSTASRAPNRGWRLCQARQSFMLNRNMSAGDRSTDTSATASDVAF